MQLNNKAYNALKDLAQLWIPAAAVLYSTIAGIWGLPDVTQVVGSLAAIDTFLGFGLKISSAGYTPPAQGTIVLDQTNPNGKTVAGMGFHEQDPEKLINILESNDTITFKVNKIQPESHPPLSVVQDPPASS